MARRESISISFTPEQAEFLTSLVERGDTSPSSEVVRAALRPFQRRHGLLDAEIDRARRDIKAGADQLGQGRIVDGEAFFAEWDAELDEMETGVEGRNATIIGRLPSPSPDGRASPVTLWACPAGSAGCIPNL